MEVLWQVTLDVMMAFPKVLLLVTVLKSQLQKISVQEREGEEPHPVTTDLPLSAQPRNK